MQLTCAGRHAGVFGFSGVHRDYKTSGQEVLEAPVKGGSAALFAREELEFERVRQQLVGGWSATATIP
jgi:hypothetical protein